ncbi:MAG: ABC transporter permease [Bifidobacteriaceae bacterium]|jgi:ABC-2 type transport system permease protein|nr:ABC transporter permease [Bifidobacteriaceae bacterium]
MGTALPLAIPAALLAIERSHGALTSVAVALSVEAFLMYALVFVVFYTIVSTATTRRNEGVLKRLRTGEAADIQVVTAICAPAFALAVGSFLLTLVLVEVFGGPHPSFFPLVLAALFGGVTVFAALGFVTSGFTKDAESAQITSLPVVLLAGVGMTNIRGILPEGPVSDLVAFTPIAVVSDMIHLGWADFSFWETLSRSVKPVLVVLAWSVASVIIARRSFRWYVR